MRIKYYFIALSLLTFGCNNQEEGNEVSDNTPQVVAEDSEAKNSDPVTETVEDVATSDSDTKKELGDSDPTGSGIDELLEEAVERKKIEAENNSITSDFHYKRAKNIFNNNVQKKIDAKIPMKELDSESIQSLNKAREELLLAITFNPKHSEAEKLLIKIDSYLGKPQSQNKELTNRASQKRAARISQIMAELNHDYKEAENLLKRKDYDQAIKQFERLKSELEFVPYDIPDNDLSERIAARISEATSAKKIEEIELNNLRLKKAEQDALYLLKQENQLYHNRIRNRFEKAQIHYDVHEYDHTIKICHEILKQDPDHEGAQQLINLSEKEKWQYVQKTDTQKELHNRTQHDLFNVANFTFDDLYRPMQFPNDYIPVTEKRLEKLFSRREQKVEEWRTRVRGKLRSPMKHELQEMPLEEIINRLMSIYDVSIICNNEIDKDQIISLPVRNLIFEQVLHLLVEKIDGDDLTWGLKNGAIYIDNTSQFNQTGFITSYDVRDLIYVISDYIGPELSLGDEGEGILITETDGDDDIINGDDLVDLLRNSTGEANWTNDFDMQIRNGVIVVNNTGRVHDQVQDLLATLRQQRALQVNILARFLTVIDRDLNHIGIDFKGLDTPLSATTLEDFAVIGNDGSAGVHLNTNSDSGSPRIGTARGAQRHWDARGRSQYFLGNGYSLFDEVSTSILNTGAAFSYQFLNDFQVEALMRATSMNQKFSKLVAPMLTCFNTQRGNISVLVQESYIRDLSVVANVNAALFDPEIGYVQTGSTLDVRPIISYDRKYITLQILPTNAELLNFRSIPVLSNLAGADVIEAPTIRYQAIRTAVSVPDRGTLLMGGLSVGQEIEDFQGIPLLSKIPILNFITGASLRDNESTNDYFLVKAIIIDQQEIEEETFGKVD